MFSQLRDQSISDRSRRTRELMERAVVSASRGQKPPYQVLTHALDGRITIIKGRLRVSVLGGVSRFCANCAAGRLTASGSSGAIWAGPLSGSRLVGKAWSVEVLVAMLAYPW